MILKKIELSNFRLHTGTCLSFSDSLNFITGGNGQGKTTLLEAVYYLCTTKSLNGSSDSEAVSFEKDHFEVEGYFRELVENKIRVYFDVGSSKKSYFLDGKQVYRSSEVIGRFPVVTLTRSDGAITWGSPGERRKFVDSVISQASEYYLKTLMEYNKTLRQRSQLLSLIKETGKRSLLQQLDVWTDTLVNLGSEIVRHRVKFAKEFNGYLAESYSFIMNESERPFINYGFLEHYESGEVEKRFYAALNELRNDELRRAQNLVGPHRDDFIFMINGLELRRYGSQGQNKTFQVALRFGEFFFLKDALARQPVFLMDDIFGELDARRANRISSYLREVGQAFITLTDFSDFSYLEKNDTDALIKINKGNAEYA